MAKLLFKKLAAVVSAASMLAVSGAVTVPAKVSSADTPIDDRHDDWLHVNENAEVVDMYGNPVWMTGCNWFGYNVTTQVFDGVWSRNMHEMLN